MVVGIVFLAVSGCTSTQISIPNKSTHTSSTPIFAIQFTILSHACHILRQLEPNRTLDTEILTVVLVAIISIAEIVVEVEPIDASIACHICED